MNSEYGLRIMAGKVNRWLMYHNVTVTTVNNNLILAFTTVCMVELYLDM